MFRNVRAEAVQSVLSSANDSDFLLGASVREWWVGLTVAIVLWLFTSAVRVIRVATRHEAGRLPILLLYVGRLFMSKKDWQTMFTTYWLPDQIAMMKGEERSLKGRTLRYGECCSYALSAALGGARQARKALEEGRPRDRLFSGTRLKLALARLKVPLMLFVAAGIGCGVTALMDTPVSMGRLALGGALGISAAWFVLLLVSFVQRRSRG
ncbi:hypothetical protein AB0F96_26930 [Streptomyces sp. NPDC023998]|uniref:hypothetical protein n=1 Tax=Streptomyces sp. NPDC023998 TaxID=3154597 RepID=UPI0033FE3191